ncbi:Os01g0674200 [Oryza sativa Japonica Group]|uniref:Os01g0674200 protein n=1 Tax=Oryza sativa subsp. japonica TaxID=39947 RepID=C7IWR3_ORYSJ|nr:Os01g0674200 [Oryza sativa Japonica Group]|eukprot:NP_001172500.1 Os01g0674200 [Oryza sativa Japonica Group]
MALAIRFRPLALLTRSGREWRRAPRERVLDGKSGSRHKHCTTQSASTYTGTPASLSGHLPRALLRPAVLAPARAPRPPRRAPSQSLAAALGIGDEGRHRWDTAAALPTAVPPSIYPLCRPVAALVQEAHQSYWKGSSRLGQQRLRLEWLDGEEKLRVDDNGSIYSKSCHVCTRMVLWTS